MARGNESSGQKMLSADCVSMLLAAIGNTTISKGQYDTMSALDGTRTASSFDHQFRSITQKAKEFKSRIDNGEKFAQVTPSKKRGANMMDGPSASVATPGKRIKAAPKTKAGGKKVANPTKIDMTKANPPSSADDLQDPYDYFGNILEQGEVKTKLEWDDESV